MDGMSGYQSAVGHESPGQNKTKQKEETTCIKRPGDPGGRQAEDWPAACSCSAKPQIMPHQQESRLREVIISFCSALVRHIQLLGPVLASPVQERHGRSGLGLVEALEVVEEYGRYKERQIGCCLQRGRAARYLLAVDK